MLLTGYYEVFLLHSSIAYAKDLEPIRYGISGLVISGSGVILVIRFNLFYIKTVVQLRYR
jgi:hypothetical protein